MFFFITLDISPKECKGIKAQCYISSQSIFPETYLFKKPSFRCRRKTGVPGEKPAEASLDWKPSGHTAPGPGIEPGLSGPQRGGSNATLPASPCLMLVTCVLSLTVPYMDYKKWIIQNPLSALGVAIIQLLP